MAIKIVKLRKKRRFKMNPQQNPQQNHPLLQKEKKEINSDFLFLLTDSLPENNELVRNYVLKVYEKLNSITDKEKTFREIIQMLLLKPDNYETFIKAIVEEEGERGIFFLDLLEKLINKNEETAKDLVKKNGYFLSILKDEKEKLLEKYQNEESAEEKLKLLEKIQKIDTILGKINQLSLSHRAEEIESFEDCYIGFVSYKIEKLSRDIIKAIEERLKEISVSTQNGGETVDFASIINQAVSAVEQTQNVSNEEIKAAITAAKEEILQTLLAKADTTAPSGGVSEEVFVNAINELKNQLEETLRNFGGEIMQRLSSNTNPQSGSSDEVLKAIESLYEKIEEINVKLSSLEDKFDEYVKEEEEFIEKFKKEG